MSISANVVTVCTLAFLSLFLFKPFNIVFVSEFVDFVTCMFCCTFM